MIAEVMTPLRRWDWNMTWVKMTSYTLVVHPRNRYLLCRTDVRLLSKPVYFPEWFDNVETSKEWSGCNIDKDDLGSMPESWISPSCTVEVEPLSPIIPDSILLSESMEDMLNTTRARIAELVLHRRMTGVTRIL